MGGESMPLYDEETLCPLCNQRIGTTPTLGFDHLDPPRGSLSATFTDSLVHRECLSGWERKEQFVKEWNELLESRGGARRLVVRASGAVEYVRPSHLEGALARWRQRLRDGV